MFTYTHTIQTSASPQAIWSLYEDVSTWPDWDAEAERITRDGPFTAGTTGTMKLRDQPPLHYRLTSVEPYREWTDETPVEEIVVRVSHRLEPTDTGGTRLTYAAEIEGPGADVIGPMITGDFPQTMHSLVALAEQRTANAPEPLAKEQS